MGLIKAIVSKDLAKRIKKMEDECKEHRSSCRRCPPGKAERVHKLYKQLGNIGDLIKKIDNPDSGSFSLHSGGWRCHRYDLTSAGIDIDKVYEYLKLIAELKAAELEDELRSYQ